ncbi:MAG TPA: ABC transporter permease [Acidimicrobiales bacterium]|nr:ABC transporter permease [Acidimicrobiales bacterium]
MTTTTLADRHALGPLPHGHYRPSGVVRAEWTKLRTVRSTTWSLLLTVVLTIGIGILTTAVAAARWHQFGAVERFTFDPTARSLTGLLFGQLVIGVLGVLVVSAEYSTGTIRATLAAVPNRPLVLAAKVLVFGLVALVVSEVTSFVAFFVGQAILKGSTPYATLGQPGVLRAVIGSGLYLTVLGLFALGLASIFRHTAGAISAFVVILLILPLILQALPQSVINAVGKFLPANIGVAMIATKPSFDEGAPFPPWVGLGILAAYALGALLIGGWLMVRRDA